MEVYHVNAGGPGAFSLSVEVPNTDTTVERWQTYEVHSIKTNARAPVDLKSQINLPAPEDDLGKQLEQTVNVYDLRRGRTLVKNIIPETKYETLTFKHFFPKILSFYKHLDFSVRKDSFRLQINLNLNENLKIFLDKFPKFDIK